MNSRHGKQGGAGIWILWGFMLTLPAYLFGGIGWLIVEWIACIILAIRSETQYQNKIGYPAVWQKGQDPRPIITAERLGIESMGFTTTEIQKEIKREIAFRNAFILNPRQKDESKFEYLSRLREIPSFRSVGLEYFNVDEDDRIFRDIQKGEWIRPMYSAATKFVVTETRRIYYPY